MTNYAYFLRDSTHLSCFCSFSKQIRYASRKARADTRKRVKGIKLRWSLNLDTLHITGLADQLTPACYNSHTHPKPFKLQFRAPFQ
ncbi:hypothetical protein SADUNF_Sadunf17G0023800 [Salix dunnii]|uniref:CCT domain-containing protein n=1 Tax=Salix dunnii TaxID=1413687 RepID=A0A835MEB5_9ROSI|nr:hypothetical protein SADUNF_Sadunf17G0023800 [Salix dunnii]